MVCMVGLDADPQNTTPLEPLPEFRTCWATCNSTSGPVQFDAWQKNPQVGSASVENDLFSCLSFKMRGMLPAGVPCPKVYMKLSLLCKVFPGPTMLWSLIRTRLYSFVWNNDTRPKISSKKSLFRLVSLFISALTS